MKLLVVKEFCFDAAHNLPGYPGDCRKVHGHHYKLQIGVRGPIQEDTGMVMDFSKMKGIVDPDRMDHENLNYLHEQEGMESFPSHMPTAENMVEWVVHSLKFPSEVELAFVRLYETPTSYAEWRKGLDD